jgi:septation ring formation regulator EzrA
MSLASPNMSLKQTQLSLKRTNMSLTQTQLSLTKTLMSLRQTHKSLKESLKSLRKCSIEAIQQLINDVGTAYAHREEQSRMGKIPYSFLSLFMHIHSLSRTEVIKKGTVFSPFYPTNVY